MSEGILTKLSSRAQLLVVIIAIVSLIVAFTGINAQSISLAISSYLFPKADYTVESWTAPTSLPIDFELSLSVSSEYFVITSVNLKSSNPYQGDPFHFSFSFENKGKKSVSQPRIVVYFVDYRDRVWGVWNESVTNGALQGCSVEYYFPPLDQKIVGTWGLFALLYDDAESVLVSYILKEFTVTDVAQRSWQETMVTLIWMIGGTGVIMVLGPRIAKYLAKRKSRKKA